MSCIDVDDADADDDDDGGAGSVDTSLLPSDVVDALSVDELINRLSAHRTTLLENVNSKRESEPNLSFLNLGIVDIS